MIPEHHLDKEITLIFNGKNLEDRLVYAELRRVQEFGYKLNGIDVSQKKLEVEQAERITRELGGDEPMKVLSEDFLQTFLVSHVNNFNEYSTVGQLLEDPTALKTPIVIKEGIMNYVDCLNDDIYEDIRSECLINERAEEHPKQEEAISSYFLQNLLEEINPKQLAVYFSVLMLALSLIYQIGNVDEKAKNFDAPPKVRLEATPAYAIVEI